MANSVLNASHFQNEDDAFAYVEARLWPNGPVCHHCGNADAKRIKKMEGKTTRKGLYKCNECRKPFTVRMGTIFESSHLPLHLWLQVIHLMCASKKGISTRQIQRMLQCSMKTAWHLTHRIREAMRAGELAPMGGPGRIVEIDETLQGKIEGAPKKMPTGRSGFWNVALTLVERGGSARSFHVDGVAMSDLLPIIRANIHRESTIFTDELSSYGKLGKEFARHNTVVHGKGEYVRYTNAVHFPSGEPTPSTPIPWRVTSASSSAACAELINGAQKSTSTATLPSSISAIRTASRLALTILSAPTAPSWASSASALPIERQLVTERPYGKSRKRKAKGETEEGA
jgi:transposase-like protein